MLLFAALPLATPPASASGLSEGQLEIWNDPAFQDRFTRSYIAETEIEPRVERDERETMQKVMAFVAANDPAAAAGLLEQKRGDRATAVFDFTLGNLFFQHERLEEAAAAYEIAVRKHPKFRRAWGNLGMAYFRQGTYDKALPALTRVIELGGADALTYGLIGYAWANAGDSLAAETAYRMAILLDPATMDWKMGLARSLFRQERFADAASLCGRLIDEDPERADLWMLQANAYIGLKQPMRAAQNYEIVDRLGGATVESLNMLGDIYINDELYDLAVQNYVRAMAKETVASTDRPLRAARVLTARSAFPEARELLDRLEEIHADRITDADRKEILKLRARIAVAQGAGDEEAAILEEVVALDPLDGEALILLGQHSRRAGETSRAINYYEQAANLEDFEAEARLRHAQLLVGEGRYAEALPLLRRTLTLEPRDNVRDFLTEVERAAKSRS